jgi:hypothetical protein
LLKKLDIFTFERRIKEDFGLLPKLLQSQPLLVFICDKSWKKNKESGHQPDSLLPCALLWGYCVILIEDVRVVRHLDVVGREEIKRSEAGVQRKGPAEM